MLDFKDKSAPKILAHRGYSGKYPENTLLAFEKAVEAGADIVEFDVQISADGNIFVIHDEKLERTTSGAGMIMDSHSKHIRKLDAGKWFEKKYRGEKIPYLGEALDLLKGKVIVFIDIKTQMLGCNEYQVSNCEIWRQKIDKVLRAVEERNIWGETIFISFDLQALLYINNHNKKAYTGFIDYRPGGKIHLLEVLKTTDINAWFISSDILNEGIVDEAHQRDIILISELISEKDIAAGVKKIKNLGVDILSTNLPGEAREIMG